MDRSFFLLFRNFSIYTFATILNAAIPFLLLPVLTKYLSPFQYGQLALIQILFIFVAPFVNVNIHAAIGIAYFKSDRSAFSSYISSSLIIPFISFMCITLLSIPLSFYIAPFINISVKWIIFIPLLCLVNVIPLVVLQLYQVKEDPMHFGQFQISQTLLNFSLSLLFVIYFHQGWEGRVYGIFLSYLLFFIFGGILLYRMGYLICQVKKEHIKDAIRFGAPLIPHVIGGALMVLTDRFFISKIVGIKDAGIYTVGFQVASILTIIFSSINQVWAPYLFNNLKHATAVSKRKIVKYSYLIFLSIIVSWCLFYFAVPIIFHIFIDKRYFESIQYVFWLSIAFSLNGMYFVFTNYISYQKKTHLLAILTFSNGTFSIIMSYTLISIFGAIGAAYSATISWCIFFIGSWILANHVYPMPWFSWWKAAAV